MENYLINSINIHKHYTYVPCSRYTFCQSVLAPSILLVTSLINDANTRYFSALGGKLNDPQIGCKAYWSILNKFINKKNIGLIP